MVAKRCVFVACHYVGGYAIREAVSRVNVLILLGEPFDPYAIDCTVKLNCGYSRIVAAVGLGDVTGQDLGDLMGCGGMGVAVRSLADLRDVLEGVLVDVAVLCGVSWPCVFAVVPTLARSGCAVALLVGDQFPELGDAYRMCDLDDLALRGGVSIGCYRSVAEICEGIGDLLSAPAGLLPSHLY